MNMGSMAMLELRKMGLYDASQQVGLWADCFKAESSQNTSSSAIVEETDGRIDNLILKEAHHGVAGTSKPYEQEASKPPDKVIRRLAQNREAAKKSRLRKKAYIQQLELSRIKLAQLEQEVQKFRQQGAYICEDVGSSTVGFTGSVNSGAAAFEMEYGPWVEEQNRQICELRAALQGSPSEIELQILVENGMRHYDELFRMKSVASKSDVFYIVSGLWKASAERFFLWIGGFRPSGLMKVLSHQMDPMTEHQLVAVYNLQQSSVQAEDALSQGLEKLRQTVSETIDLGQMGEAMGKLKVLISFVDQADRLRQEALQQMCRILTTHQAARGLLALGDYVQRLRTLSALWAARPREPA